MAPRSGYGTRFTKDYFSSQKHGRGRVAAARFGPPLQRARADPGRPARVLSRDPGLPVRWGRSHLEALSGRLPRVPCSRRRASFPVTRPP